MTTSEHGTARPGEMDALIRYITPGFPDRTGGVQRRDGIPGLCSEIASILALASDHSFRDLLASTISAGYSLDQLGGRSEAICIRAAHTIVVADLGPIAAPGHHAVRVGSWDRRAERAGGIRGPLRASSVTVTWGPQDAQRRQRVSPWWPGIAWRVAAAVPELDIRAARLRPMIAAATVQRGLRPRSQYDLPQVRRVEVFKILYELAGDPGATRRWATITIEPTPGTHPGS